MTSFFVAVLGFAAVLFILLGVPMLFTWLMEVWEDQAHERALRKEEIEKEQKEVDKLLNPYYDPLEEKYRALYKKQNEKQNEDYEYRPVERN